MSQKSIKNIFLFSILSVLFICEEIETLEKDRMKEIVSYVNEIHTTWSAKMPKRDYTYTLGARPELFDVSKNPHKNKKLTKEKETKIKREFPEHYDAREAYPECADIIGIVHDQSNCGSCWAISSTSVMSDRLCIKSKGKIKKIVSALNLISCNYQCYGCFGGLSNYAFDYWISTGIVSGGLYNDTDTCQPYQWPPCDHHMDHEIYGECGNVTNTPNCKTTCQEGYDISYKDDMTYGNSSYFIHLPTEEQIMEEIIDNGPVCSSFTVYEDFYAYKSGVYKNVVGDYKGSHEITIIGWGVENGVKYWLCVNSWNKTWGENGLFKILRGEMECRIEAMITAGTPKL